MPPPHRDVESPARIALSRMPTARTLEAHTLLMVSEETSLGMPASIWAWREGIWPWPGLQDLAHHDVLDLVGLTPARSRQPRWRSHRAWSGRDERPPPSFPTGVRAALRITVLDIPETLVFAASHGRSCPTEAPPGTGADTIAVGLFEDEGSPTTPPAARSARSSSRARPKPAFRKLALMHADGKRWLVAGLGKRDEFDPERARVVAAA
jgi:hypothetical protein